MSRSGIRPHVWVSGPDPERHRRYLQWLQQRNQAQFRKEGWELEFDDWLDLWGTNIQYRGRKKGSMTMVRIRYDEPWSKLNARIVDRLEHSRVQREMIIAKRQELRQQFEMKK
jgi:hypothetical protein